MFTKQDLMESFAVVDEGSSGHYFFQHKLPKVTYSYCLKSSSDRDILIVAEDVDDRKFAAEVLDQAPSLLSPAKPNIYKLARNEYGFTHAIAVPSTYHASLKGRLEPKRGKLFLCVPIYRNEFSGDETESEFKEIMTRMIPVFRWNRSIYPKLKVYFDNPRTGSGTHESGVLLKLPTLISEVENLNGVVNGFIEVTNYKGEVLEVLSPREDVYTMIRNRKDEESMGLPKLLQILYEFSEA